MRGRGTLPTARPFMQTCPRCGSLARAEAFRCGDCGTRLGLSSERIADVGEAALFIQHAAGKVRDLTNGEPHGQPRGKRYVALRDLTRDLEDARRRLLELWS